VAATDQSSQTESNTRTDLGTMSRHAGTIVVGQPAVMAFSIADTIVAGRYATDALAVLSIGLAIYVSVFVSLNRVLQALMTSYV
jgi:multidrug resistance protein, MATE family